MDSFSVGGITRLLTAGCSFTKHCWPTWANYLGRHYEWHKNLAVGGSDNANIARNIIKNAKQNDVVVVMWTGYDRLNFFNNDWDYAGCLVGNKEFYANYYSPIERFTKQWIMYRWSIIIQKSKDLSAIILMHLIGSCRSYIHKFHAK